MKALVTNGIRQDALFRLYKHHILDSVLIVKRSGPKELIRQRGWKVVGTVVGYYLVRDTFIYIVLPYCVAKGLL